MQRDAFIKDTQKIVEIHNCDKEARRQAWLESDKKRKKALYQKFLKEKAQDEQTHNDNSSVDMPVKKKAPTTKKKRFQNQHRLTLWQVICIRAR